MPEWTRLSEGEIGRNRGYGSVQFSFLLFGQHHYIRALSHVKCTVLGAAKVVIYAMFAELAEDHAGKYRNSSACAGCCSADRRPHDHSPTTPLSSLRSSPLSPGRSFPLCTGERGGTGLVVVVVQTEEERPAQHKSYGLLNSAVQSVFNFSWTHTVFLDMATRPLTSKFVSIRNSSKSNRSLHHKSRDSDDAPILVP